MTNNSALLECPVAPETLRRASDKANSYLAILPTLFNTSGDGFYSILNQRNLSGFIGEVLKHAIFSTDPLFVPNPHPDGRPDLLDLRVENVRAYFEENCFDQSTRTPRRDALAPFKHGGIEIKCSIGKLKNAGEKPVGVPRYSFVNGLTYWAHHAHPCDLLGVYYDYDDLKQGVPQIYALFFTKLSAGDWHKVSTGNPDKKKTSNTSLNKMGLRKLYDSLILYKDDQRCKSVLDRLGISR